ncbi:hypothetical protein [Clostridium sp. 001]|nr:hypothetical protein [Clostridium sp. 001]
MNEKTTLYLEEDLKQNVKIQLIKNGENQSLSNLVNQLLLKWYQEQKQKE